MRKFDDNVRKIPLDYVSLNRCCIEDVLPFKQDIIVEN